MAVNKVEKFDNYNQGEPMFVTIPKGSMIYNRTDTIRLVEDDIYLNIAKVLAITIKPLTEETILEARLSTGEVVKREVLSKDEYIKVSLELNNINGAMISNDTIYVYIPASRNDYIDRLKDKIKR